jgi:Flp pilus assembly protein TadB
MGVASDVDAPVDYDCVLGGTTMRTQARAMPQPNYDPRRIARGVRIQFDSARVSWWRKLFVLPIVLALFALLFLLGMALWVLFAMLAAIVAIGGLILAVLPRRRRRQAGGETQVIEGESRRIDDEAP